METIQAMLHAPPSGSGAIGSLALATPHTTTAAVPAAVAAALPVRSSKRQRYHAMAVAAAVAAETDPRIVIRGDAKLNFRQVREAMQAIEQAGFRGVGLIAKGRNSGAQGD